MTTPPRFIFPYSKRFNPYYVGYCTMTQAGVIDIEQLEK